MTTGRVGGSIATCAAGPYVCFVASVTGRRCMMIDRRQSRAVSRTTCTAAADGRRRHGEGGLSRDERTNRTSRSVVFNGGAGA
jgi:hypothetical protein